MEQKISDNIYDYENEEVEIVRKDGTVLQGVVLLVTTNYEAEEVTDPQLDVEYGDVITTVCLSTIDKITIIR